VCSDSPAAALERPVSAVRPGGEESDLDFPAFCHRLPGENVRISPTPGGTDYPSVESARQAISPLVPDLSSWSHLR